MKDYTININGNQYAVSVHNAEDSSATVTVNGTEFQVEHQNVTAKKSAANKVTKTITPSAAPVAATTAAAPAPANAAGRVISSPLPGTILSINVKEGDTVKAGDRLLLLEAMKMENNIDADKDGVVTKVHVQTGDSVLEGAALVTLQ